MAVTILALVSFAAFARADEISINRIRISNNAFVKEVVRNACCMLLAACCLRLWCSFGCHERDHGP